MNEYKPDHMEIDIPATSPSSESSVDDSEDAFIDDEEVDDEGHVQQPDDEDEEEQDFKREEPLTDEEIDELVAELVEVERKAAEAQEALEEDSIATIEEEVKEELGQTLSGVKLEKAVAEEMATYKEQWDATLDELETECAYLLEQLDGAGIELPSLYKLIESQIPKGCCTEAWKKRAHWVGSELSSDVTESIAKAEKFLQTHRPVRRKHGKILEEGASGFLQKKLNDGNEAVTQNPDVDWNSFSRMCSNSSSLEKSGFGSKQWASVYLASTPQQAAELGLKFPGVDEVEEIDDIEGNASDPFLADAIAIEEDPDLSEEQKRKFRKVKEEDDASFDKKLFQRLKRRRRRNKDKKEELHSVYISDDCGSDGLKDSCEHLEKREGEVVSIDSDDEANVVQDESLPVHNESEKMDQANFHDHRHKQLDAYYRCTACDRLANEVHRHPLLKVIVCSECKIFLESKNQALDNDLLECYCGWCGRSNDLINCTSCKTLFCAICVTRNFGEEFCKKVKSCGWQCCCCSPNILQDLSLQLEKLMATKGLSVSSSDSESDSGSDSESDDSSDSDFSVKTSSKINHQKKIRRILDDAELGEETKRKIAIEKERQERLKSLGAQFSHKSVGLSSTITSVNLHGGDNVEVLGDASTGYIVNVVREEGEAAVRIPSSISIKLKPHQIAGIRFMWENIIQSVRKVKSGDKGLGCILAHTMGLGKTFQVIAFLYTAMRSVDLGLRTVLIVTPVSVLHNWRQEFAMWKPSELKSLRVYMLQDVTRERRAEILMKWRSKGGVFLIGYTAFRNLTLGKHVKDHKMAREITLCLQEGPDILVCDEAHIIKNTRADVTHALKQVKCQRRIALTGSPLQNNMMEYYCMVDFVREGFLGSSHEFRNRFQNPIENGQHTNSTAEDVKVMNQRSHILYEQLKGFVQRMDMNVVKNDLPSKTVFVISVKLSTLQRKLYKRFLDAHGFTTPGENIRIKGSFWAGYQSLAQIWNHPGVLQLIKDRKVSAKHVDVLEADDSSSEENMDYNVIPGEKPVNNSALPSRKNDNSFHLEEWWTDIIRGTTCTELEHGGKMVMLLDILKMCCKLGDRALVFSQSLSTLDLIERYLSKFPRSEKKKKYWKRGKDWYRLDGRTESSERQKLVERFNEPLNSRVKCTLMSTKAGSLGINLPAANRVIIVDGSWNPTYDLQAIFRVWRYGQKKPVFAYRLLAHGTMEEKIYKRQVTKESLAARVVDRQQVHRSISKEEMLHLFDLGDDELPGIVPGTSQVPVATDAGLSSKAKESIPHGNTSSDTLMQHLLDQHHPRWIANYHEHETLLQENEDERLSKEEQDMAWEVYRRTFEWEEVQRVAPVASASGHQPTKLNETAANEKPVVTESAPPSHANREVPRLFGRARDRVLQRQCTKLSHLLTLRSQGTKMGCSTVCGECAREISWESFKNDGRSVKI